MKPEDLWKLIAERADAARDGCGLLWRLADAGGTDTETAEKTMGMIEDSLSKAGQLLQAIKTAR